MPSPWRHPPIVRTPWPRFQGPPMEALLHRALRSHCRSALSTPDHLAAAGSGHATAESLELSPEQGLVRAGRPLTRPTRARQALIRESAEGPLKARRDFTGGRCLTPKWFIQHTPPEIRWSWNESAHPVSGTRKDVDVLTSTSISERIKVIRVSRPLGREKNIQKPMYEIFIHVLSSEDEKRPEARISASSFFGYG